MDWIDIGLHISIAGLVVWLLNWVSDCEFWPFTLLMNTLVWPIREIIQHSGSPLEIVTHPQSLLEWVAPVLTGLAVIVYMNRPVHREPTEYDIYEGE